jgi:cytochrome bd-type quinol oxidase subunit 2
MGNAALTPVKAFDRIERKVKAELGSSWSINNTWLLE